MSKADGLTVFAVFALAIGCGEGDPSGISADPGTMLTGGDAGQGTTGSSDAAKGDVNHDGPVDRDPGYRDPRQADAACASPNKVCATDASPNVCIAVGTDVANCGECGKTCLGPSATCVASLCTCMDVGFEYCAATGCTDVTADRNNCGRCGNVCDPTLSPECAAGACVIN